MTKELLELIKEEYKAYFNFQLEKKTISSDNKVAKEGFLEKYFGDESEVSKEEKKKIKKEISKYFRTIEEVGSGADPVTEVKKTRELALDLTDTQYSELIQIFNYIQENVKKKKEINEKLDTLYLELGMEMGHSSDTIKEFLKIQYNSDLGKQDYIVKASSIYNEVQRELEQEK
jgi:hypothetical protein